MASACNPSLARAPSDGSASVLSLASIAWVRLFCVAALVRDLRTSRKAIVASAHTLVSPLKTTQERWVRSQRTRGRAERELDLQRERFSLLERAVILAVLARLRRRSSEDSILVSLRQILVRRSRDEQPVRDVLRHVQNLAVRAALSNREQATAASALGMQAGGRNEPLEERLD